MPTISLALPFVLAAFRRLQILPRQRLKKLLPAEAFLKWRALHKMNLVSPNLVAPLV